MYVHITNNLCRSSRGAADTTRRRKYTYIVKGAAHTTVVVGRPVVGCTPRSRQRRRRRRQRRWWPIENLFRCGYVASSVLCSVYMDARASACMRSQHRRRLCNVYFLSSPRDVVGALEILSVFVGAVVAQACKFAVTYVFSSPSLCDRVC